MPSIFYVALSTFVALAAAQNPFNNPTEGYSFSAGTPTTLSWDPTAGTTVSLILQWGTVFTTASGITIASSITNSGNYTWTPSASLPARSDYTIEIVDDQDTSQYNFLPRFSIAGVTGVASASASSTATSGTSTGTASSTAVTLTSSAVSSTSTASTSGSTSSSTSTTASSSSSTPSSSASATSTTVPNINAGITNKVSGGMLALVFGAAALL